MSIPDDKTEALEHLRQSRIALEQAFNQAFRAVDRAIEWVESWEAEGP